MAKEAGLEEVQARPVVVLREPLAVGEAPVLALLLGAVHLLAHRVLREVRPGVE